VYVIQESKRSQNVYGRWSQHVFQNPATNLLSYTSNKAGDLNLDKTCVSLSLSWSITEMKLYNNLGMSIL
jgi:hypothetical protein